MTDRVGRSAPVWRVTLAADALSHVALARALEDICEAISSFEATPGGSWRIDGVTTTEPDRGELATRLALAAASVGRLPPAVHVEKLPATDWLAENRRAFPPLRVGRCFIFGSHFTGRPPAGMIAIALDASIAFGTGEHATTRGCLLALEAMARRRRIGRALDLGCGSGILAIVAARLWARPVTAADIDADAVRIARENARRNRVGRLVRALASNGDGRLRARRRYDLVVANILARPLCRLARGIARATRPGGTVILSGLLATQEPEVLAAYRQRRLRLRRRIALSGWHTLVLQRGRSATRG
jgi:ribosomal protein L11 methyltransferase